MTYASMHPALRAFFGAWEFFRKLGFTSEQLFMQIANSAMSKGAESCFCVLEAQNKKFTIDCGPIGGIGVEAFKEEFLIAVDEINHRRMSDEDLDRLIDEHQMFKDKVRFLQAFLAKGFVLPKDLN